MMVKLLNSILIGIIVLLLIISIIALIAIHWKLAHYDFTLTPEGVKFYLSSYGKYTTLFSATIVTCAAYFGSLKVIASIETNKEKIKQDIFNEWKLTAELRAIEQAEKNPVLKRELLRIRRKLFNTLYDWDFNVKDKDYLTVLFNIHIKDLIDIFETQNSFHCDLGGVYPDDKYSYAYDSFRYIFMGMLDSSYDNIENDLKELYLESMSKNRNINPSLHRSALTNYRPRKRLKND